MKKQIVLAVCCASLLVITLLQWFEHRALDAKLNALEAKLNSLQSGSSQLRPPMYWVQSRNAPEPEVSPRPTKPHFMLIDSGNPDLHSEGVSSVGVPWSVEHAMLGGANENQVPRRIEEPNESKRTAAQDAAGASESK